MQIENVKALHAFRSREANDALERLQQSVNDGGNIFEELMKACKVCSLGQISTALFKVGGQYRRNM
jgi:methylmalonyl-CoA mutase